MRQKLFFEHASPSAALTRSGITRGSHPLNPSFSLRSLPNRLSYIRILSQGFRQITRLPPTVIQKVATLLRPASLATRTRTRTRTTAERATAVPSFDALITAVHCKSLFVHKALTRTPRILIMH